MQAANEQEDFALRADAVGGPREVDVQRYGVAVAEVVYELGAVFAVERAGVGGRPVEEFVEIPPVQQVGGRRFSEVERHHLMAPNERHAGDSDGTTVASQVEGLVGRRFHECGLGDGPLAVRKEQEEGEKVQKAHGVVSGSFVRASFVTGADRRRMV